MKPAEEQQAILDATGRVLRVNARAGTGKTTTLQMITSAHPGQSKFSGTPRRLRRRGRKRSA